jgi:hypothetical protein
MPLKTVECKGKIPVQIIGNGAESACPEFLTFECLKVKKVFDEFALRDCVEGVKFELDSVPRGGSIEPTLVLKHCKLCDVEIKDVSSNTMRMLKFSGKCCCDVFGKDQKGNLIRMRVVDIPDCNTNLSIGECGELCFRFSVRREYPYATCENFKNLLHFLDEGRFELQCFSEAVIDELNNETDCELLVTNLGVFLAVKFDAEVQVCVPVLGYCEIEEILPIEDSFCERFEMEFDLPSFNPAQLDRAITPYNSL